VAGSGAFGGQPGHALKARDAWLRLAGRRATRRRESDRERRLSPVSGSLNLSRLGSGDHPAPWCCSRLRDPAFGGKRENARLHAALSGSLKDDRRVYGLPRRTTDGPSPRPNPVRRQGASSGAAPRRAKARPTGSPAMSTSTPSPSPSSPIVSPQPTSTLLPALAPLGTLIRLARLFS
jgi:hypothetical protein